MQREGFNGFCPLPYLKMKILGYILLMVLLSACTRTDLPQPQTIQLLSYNVENSSVTFHVVDNSNVRSYELFAGNDGHQLCVIDSVHRNKSGLYTMTDAKLSAYYMIGYISKDGLKFFPQFITRKL